MLKNAILNINGSLEESGEVFGGQALSEFVKVRHAVPLESLQDVFSFDELRDFDAHVREEEPDAEYSVKPKVDGLSVALEYVDGRFVRAVFAHICASRFAVIVLSL